jgi:putative acetyltransferase
MLAVASHDDGVVVRPERADDVASIRIVVDEAFAPDRTVGPLVEAIRASDRFVPSLSQVAADRDGVVVGHVMLSHADVVGADDVAREVLTLSPVSVTPSWQRRGVGTRLCRAVLALAEEMGEPLVFVEGHPTYYPRFGFRLATELGIEIRLPSWAPKEAAMAKLLGARPGEITGRAVLPPAFDDVVEH